MEKSADAFRTISEVADDLTLPQHVLRFWESRFPQIRPLKRAGGRRYYRPADVVLLKAIRQLLYDDGYTIKGVQRLLKEQGARGLAAAPPVVVAGLDLEEGLAQGEGPQQDLATAERQHADVPDDPADQEASHRDALVTAIATIDECLRILETARRSP